MVRGGDGRQVFDWVLDRHARRAGGLALVMVVALLGSWLAVEAVARAAALVLSTSAASASARRSLASRRRSAMRSRRSTIFSPATPAVARDIGFFGVRVTRSDALEDALRQALAHDGPALVDVVTARQELAMPPKIKAEQAKGFSLFALRAVMSGRGDELVELARTNLLR